MIWGLAPKHQYHSSLEIKVAINLDVCLFNDGFEAASLRQVDTSPLQIDIWRSIDKERIRSARYRYSEKKRSSEKLQGERNAVAKMLFQHMEGKRYYGSNMV